MIYDRDEIYIQVTYKANVYHFDFECYYFNELDFTHATGFNRDDIEDFKIVFKTELKENEIIQCDSCGEVFAVGRYKTETAE